MSTQIFKELFIHGTKQKVLATSYSQIESFLGCGYRWYRDYLLGEREVTEAEALNLGTAIHSTLEQYFNGVAQGKEFTVGQAQDILAFNMEVEDIPFASEENKLLAEQQHNDMMEGLVNGNSVLAKFMEDKEVVACEKDFQLCIELPFKVAYKDELYDKIYIVGSVDFIVKDKNGDLHVVDFKSGKKTFEAKKLKENLQLPIYSLVVRQIYGRLPKSTRYYFTRLDVFQEVLSLALCEEDCKHIYYKNGKIKQEQKTVDKIYNELIEIFRKQYTVGKSAYKAKPCALCSYCNHSPWYGNLANCEYAMFYRRKDIPIPKQNRRVIRRG